MADQGSAGPVTQGGARQEVAQLSEATQAERSEARRGLVEQGSARLAR